MRISACSSDVCSSDLARGPAARPAGGDATMWCSERPCVVKRTRRVLMVILGSGLPVRHPQIRPFSGRSWGLTHVTPALIAAGGEVVAGSTTTAMFLPYCRTWLQIGRAHV